jgi:tRNA pseudouridine38-40 synthase
MVIIFSGWQYQESPPTVQCALEKALIQSTKLQRKDLQLVGASRTDAGVHAWGQVRPCSVCAISTFK